MQRQYGLINDPWTPGIRCSSRARSGMERLYMARQAKSVSAANFNAKMICKDHG